MSTILGIAARAVLVIWIGSLWTIGVVVAPVLFAVLPDSSLAGLVAGRLFTIEAYISLISAPLLLLLWRRCYPDLPLWPKIVVAIMWLLAAAGEWWLRPLMAAAREGAEGSAASFAALHGVASVMYFGVVGGGVALLFARVWGASRD